MVPAGQKKCTRKCWGQWKPWEHDENAVIVAVWTSRKATRTPLSLFRGPVNRECLKGSSMGSPIATADTMSWVQFSPRNIVHWLINWASGSFEASSYFSFVVQRNEVKLQRNQPWGWYFWSQLDTKIEGGFLCFGRTTQQCVKLLFPKGGKDKSWTTSREKGLILRAEGGILQQQQKIPNTLEYVKLYLKGIESRK